MGVTVKSWWITSTAYSSSFNLVAFLLNNLYMSYKHPNDYVLWKVGMRETPYVVNKVHNMEKQMQDCQNADASIDQTPSIVGGNSVEEELSVCSASTDASLSESEETSHSICSRSKTLIGFMAVEKRRASMSHLAQHSSPELSKRSQHRNPEMNRRISTSFCDSSVNSTPDLIEHSSTMEFDSQYNDFDLDRVDSLNRFSPHNRFVYPPTPPRRSFTSKRRNDMIKNPAFTLELSHEGSKGTRNRRSFISQRQASRQKLSYSPESGMRRPSYRRSYMSQHRDSEINQRTCTSTMHNIRS